MLVEKPKLHLMAKQAIEKLEQAGKKILPDDVLWLHHLADKVSNPAPRTDALDWISHPLKCGNRLLRPLSVAGVIWWEECASKWFFSSDMFQILSLAYAMENGRKEGAFDSLSSESSARVRLFAWAMGTTASLKEIEDAVNILIDQNDMVDIGPATAARRADARVWGDIICMLCSECGGSPMDWIWDYTPQQVMQCVDKVMSSNAAKAGISLDNMDAKAGAFREFHAAVDSIKNREQ